jgi:hypothetical protein
MSAEPFVVTRRVLTELGVEGRDGDDFLDRGRTPRVVEVAGLASLPAVWVTAPPWLGKTTVARGMYAWLLDGPTPFGQLDGRVALTELGRPGVDREIPPDWWGRWLREPTALPAVCIIDGLDGGADQNDRLLDAVLTPLERLTDGYLRSLRLVLFSRPHTGLVTFRDRLGHLYPRYTERALREFTLARVDRGTAEALVGPEDFPRVLEAVRGNGLESVAGYPVVLRFLKRHPSATGLSLVEVWRGVLGELLGRSQRDRGRPFQTEPEERFEAAGRISAVLTLTRRETIREYSPAQDEPTLGSLFGPEPGSNRHQLAAREVCQTAAFQALPEEGAYRFAQRNIQDWLTAFALAGLPRPALVTAMSDASGRLLPRLREVARLVRVITHDAGIRADLDRMTGGADLPSDAIEPSLGQALACLDRLEGLARESAWGLRLDADGGNGLGRLGVPGLENELVRRLADPARPAQVKRLLIEVAEATRAVGTVDTAVRLVLSPEEEEGVREAAMHFVCRLGGDAHLRELEVPIGEGPGSSDIDGRLRGVLIFELLNRGLWPAWKAARYAPAAARHILDHRALLLHVLRQRMTAECARRLLPHFTEVAERHADERDHGIPKILEHAVGLVLGQDQLPPEDAGLLVRLTLEMLGETRFRSDALTIGLRLRGFAEVRRAFYRYDAELLLRGEGATAVGRRLLTSEDRVWLRQRARGEWATLAVVWTDLFHLGEVARREGRMSEPEYDALVAEIEERVPGLPARIEEERRRAEEQERRWRSELDERRAHRPAERSLEEVVHGGLSRVDCLEADRMRELGFLCFYPEVRPYFITGTWEDLPDVLQGRVLDACRRGLESGRPSPLLEGDGVSSLTLGEAASFEHLAISAGAHSWLTDELIGRWLPIALHSPISRGWTDVIRVCWSASREATERAVAEAVVDGAGRYERPSQPRMIPAECWTELLSETVIELIFDGSRPAATRCELLEILAVRDLDRALPVAERWAHLPVSETPEDQLRRAGRNVLLCRDPDAVLAMAEREFDERGASCLEELHALTGGQDELRADWRRWPVSRQGRLAALLVRAHPFGGVPDEESVSWGTGLRIVRDAVIDSLLGGTSAEHAEALDRLAELDPHLRRIVLARRASSSAARALRENDPGLSNDPSALSLQTVRQLLERKDFRLIRSDDDLLDAVLFALDLVQREVGHDLALLYAPPETKRAPRGKRPQASDPDREHLREDALQAYLRRRLKDELAGVAEGVEVQIVREDQVSYRRRFDLRVTAPCHGSRRLATVVVEIKWSTNPETRAALVDQLGRNYLLGEGLTCGVFLVGWSGWWRPGQKQSRGRDPAELSRFLRGQRDSFCREGQPGSGVRIEPVVLDLSWRRAEVTDGVNDGRATPSPGRPRPQKRAGTAPTAQRPRARKRRGC